MSAADDILFFVRSGYYNGNWLTIADGSMSSNYWSSYIGQDNLHVFALVFFLDAGVDSTAIRPSVYGFSLRCLAI